MEAGNTTAASAATTRTTTTTTTTIKEPCLRFDASYAFSVGGILKFLQILLNLIGFILILSSGEGNVNLTRAKYYCFVSGMGFCVSSILLFLYFLHIIQRTHMIPWFKIEISYCLLWILFHLVAGFLTIGLTNGYFDTAGYFAFAAMAVYTLEALYDICRITMRSA